MYKLKLVSESLSACRVCLATNSKLHSISDGLEDKFIQLMGVEFSASDGLPQHLCSYCRALLLKLSGFKTRCVRAQEILQQAKTQHAYLSTDIVCAIDRNCNKLALNLTQFNLDNINININEETIKLEDYSDHYFDDREELAAKIEIEANNEVAEHLNQDIDETELKPQVFIEIDDINKSKRSTTKARCKRRIKVKRIVKKDTTESAQCRVKKPLMVKNKIHEAHVKEFETKNDCTFQLLSFEEQIQEIEDRKRSSNYLNLDYKCERCARGFELEQPYKNHMIKHDPCSGDFVCEVCGIHFATQHQKRHHTECHRIKFTCNICSFVTRTKHHAFRHFQEHNGFRYVCKYCGAKFKKASTHGTHVRVQHAGHAQHAPCDVCGETFVGAAGLTMHKAKVHKQDAEIESETNECASCGVQFASSYARRRHILTSARNKCSPTMRPCRVCGENLPSEESLEDHSRSRHANKQTVCDQCNKSFQSEASLSVHYERFHLAVKCTRLKAVQRMRKAAGGLVCELCGKTCTNKTILTYHQRTHTGEKPHACPRCPKNFLSPNLLQSHLRSHTGEKPYKCSHCEKAFAYKSALNVHKTVHTGEKPYPCSLCDKTFTQAASVHTHIKYVHMKLPAPPRRRNNKP